MEQSKQEVQVFTVPVLQQTGCDDGDTVSNYLKEEDDITLQQVFSFPIKYRVHIIMQRYSKIFGTN
jgi:hypothetical protein